MPHLRDDLQSALGTAYTLERELGGGGMSRVFVALETRFGRRVVVKVLSPDLVASVSADRFEREIRLAATSTSEPTCMPSASWRTSCWLASIRLLGSGACTPWSRRI